MPTKVISCDCSNVQQDKIHGAGRRAMNKTAKDEWRCTSCDKIKASGGGEKKESKK